MKLVIETESVEQFEAILKALRGPQTDFVVNLDSAQPRVAEPASLDPESTADDKDGTIVEKRKRRSKAELEKVKEPAAEPVVETNDAPADEIRTEDPGAVETNDEPAETPAAETPAAETPAAETPAAETPAAETPAAKGEKPITNIDELRGYVTGRMLELKGQAKNDFRTKNGELLKKYGVPKVGDLPKDKWDAYYAEVKEF